MLHSSTTNIWEETYLLIAKRIFPRNRSVLVKNTLWWTYSVMKMRIAGIDSFILHIFIELYSMLRIEKFPGYKTANKNNTSPVLMKFTVCFERNIKEANCNCLLWKIP